MKNKALIVSLTVGLLGVAAPALANEDSSAAAGMDKHHQQNEGSSGMMKMDGSSGTMNIEGSSDMMPMMKMMKQCGDMMQAMQDHIESSKEHMDSSKDA